MTDSTTELTPAAPVSWPDGKTCAVAFTFDVDAESPLLTTDPAFADRMGTMSHQAYGPLVGVPRLLGILDEFNVPGTFFVPGYTAHRHPEPIRSIARAGHEIAHHGYLHESLVGADEDTERKILTRGIEALEEVAGVHPVGYRAPMWEMNWHTPKLLAEFGFLYDSTLMDSDHPYELAVGDGSLVELPVSWALDDWQQYCFVPDFSGTGLIETPAKAIELWRAELNAMRDIGGAGCSPTTRSSADGPAARPRCASSSPRCARWTTCGWRACPRSPNTFARKSSRRAR